MFDFVWITEYWNYYTNGFVVVSVLVYLFRGNLLRAADRTLTAAFGSRFESLQAYLLDDREARPSRPPRVTGKRRSSRKDL